MEKMEYETRHQKLRDLAWEMDIRLGLETRKLILAGNERLAFSSNSGNWNEWVSMVEKRLSEIPTSVSTKNLIVQNRIISLKNLLSLPNGN